MFDIDTSVLQSMGTVSISDATGTKEMDAPDIADLNKEETAEEPLDDDESADPIYEPPNVGDESDNSSSDDTDQEAVTGAQGKPNFTDIPMFVFPDKSR